jgi:hypothetical protein
MLKGTPRPYTRKREKKKFNPYNTSREDFLFLTFREHLLFDCCFFKLKKERKKENEKGVRYPGHKNVDT